MTELFPKIKSLQHVESVNYGGQDGSKHKFTLHTTKGSDIREKLFRQAVAENWVMLEMTRSVTSLEEVFHKLTRAEEPKK
jgi:hypothetical protein